MRDSDNMRILKGDLDRLIKKMRKNMNALDILAHVILTLRDLEFVYEED